MTDSNQLESMEFGEVKISNDVVGTIANIAASEIEGVNGLSGGIAGDIAEMFGRKNLAKGVRVNTEEKTVELDLNIIVDFGMKIPEVSWHIQESVKQSVETMTGLTVKMVNVHVVGVNIPEQKTEPATEVFGG
ncbi:MULTISPECIES: Asp23/Gls24 family envelope stress response protein [unclassified Fusibacter]|uniref:Asp23/Gls24 family envelope stress response protein n=1 Tax=unclassified Fusibacter TaxID=2624464 RepID=UPI001012B28C|nr:MULTISPECIES: Asp23/Gls24 family envelope stress response protein [unclassified Fusibacter]MCK8058889.1 Asp23/Gls24 family envelope stress response protein [Fusibacter sp. A2]NPE21964.1 Asp23/Gls24 family envelope stress response protein [Fusibacter sp. A1]RXV61532.1 Asp23/Gls24 family envelope stress response protein [Fusibacter sp. A1]